MSANYDFILDLAAAAAAPPARLLDFGCGSGEVVRRARERGFDVAGADTYEEGWACLASGVEALHRIGPDGRLPFPDAAFDVAVTNMVLEHVRDLPPVVAELARVVRPGGALVTLFPTRELLFEGHVRLPLVHRLGHCGQHLVLAAAHALRRPEVPREAWVAHWQRNLAEVVFYRPEAEVLAVIGRHFRLEARREAELVRFRLRRSRLAGLTPLVASRLLDAPLRRFCLRAATMAAVWRRPGHP